MNTKDAAKFVANKKNVYRPSPSTIRSWARKAWRLKAFKNPFLTGNERNLGVLAWDIPQENLSNFLEKQCRKIDKQIRCSVSMKNPALKMSIDEYIEKQISKRKKEHAKWLNEKVSERKQVIEKLRSERKKGNTAKARDREAELRGFIKFHKTDFSPESTSGREIRQGIAEDYLTLLSRGIIIGDKPNKKAISSLGDYKEEFMEIIDKAKSEISKTKKEKLNIAKLKGKKYKLSNYDIVVAPMASERFINRIKYIKEYSLVWALHYKGCFYRVTKENVRYLSYSTKELKRYDLEHRINMEKLKVIRDKVVAKISPNKYRLADFCIKVIEMKKKYNLEFDKELIYSHRSIFNECIKNKNIFHDYPDIYLFSSPIDKNYTKLSKLAKSNNDYPYFKKQPLKGNSFSFGEKNNLRYEIKVDKDPYSKDYKLFLERFRFSKISNGGKERMAWLRDQTYWIIGNISISDRSQGLKIIKEVVKYFLGHDEYGVAMFDLGPLREELNILTGRNKQ